MSSLKDILNEFFDGEYVEERYTALMETILETEKDTKLRFPDDCRFILKEYEWDGVKFDLGLFHTYYIFGLQKADSSFAYEFYKSKNMLRAFIIKNIPNAEHRSQWLNQLEELERNL